MSSASARVGAAAISAKILSRSESSQRAMEALKAVLRMTSLGVIGAAHNKLSQVIVAERVTGNAHVASHLR